MATGLQVKQAAATVGCSASSIRAWCATFSEFLSPTANPGPDRPRLFTDQDIAIFQRIQELRTHERLSFDEITERLRREDLSALQPYIDAPTANLQQSTTPQPTVTPPEPPQQPTQAIELYSAILGHTAALQARMDALQAQQDSQAKQQVGRVTLFAVGVLVGLAVALIVVGVIWLGR